MIKTLIIDDNLHYSKQILNNVLNNFKDVQLMYIATTCKEGLDIINNNNIDLIFLDINLPDDSGFKLLNELNNLNIMQKPRVVLISGDPCLIYQAREDFNNYDIIDKITSIEEIYKQIKRIINHINYENNSGKIRQFVSSEIFNLGYNIKYKGTQYIIEAIIYVYENNNYDLVDNLEKNVYKYIGFKHKKTVNNIKTNIIKATKEIESQTIYSLTPKSIIMTVLNKIQQNFDLSA